MGAGFCHKNVFRQYDGFHPYGYKDCENYAFKFYFKNTSSRNWSPCYRDEDAVAMGLAKRDAAGTKWYKDQGYDVQNNYTDCGDWYFQIHCTQHCSPCYRDKDVCAVGIPNRDALGDKWCKTMVLVAKMELILAVEIGIISSAVSTNFVEVAQSVSSNI